MNEGEQAEGNDQTKEFGSMTEMGNLEPVDLRSIWPDEAGDFTPWLRDNIGRVGDVLGIGFDTVNTEEPVGRYNADLWCQEEAPQSRGIVIENQLTDSNHDHLGKLLTYGSGLNADISIWIAPLFRDEHLHALTSLNESNAGKRLFFAIQVEVFKIGESAPAPFFKLLVRPTNWNTTRRTPSATPSPRMRAYQEFFDRFLADLKKRQDNFTRTTNAGYQNWLSLPSGRSGFVYSFGFTREQRIRVELYIDLGEKDKTKAAFHALESKKNEIEQELGTTLAWERLDDARASRVAMYRPGSIDYASEKLEELSQWGVEGAIKFRETFGKHIRNV